MSKLPDFMVVGGVKCGTTSLYYYLKSHPEICAPCKESYLFTPRLNQEAKPSAKQYSIDEYQHLFEKSITESTRAAGEVSSIYLYCHEEVIPEIRRILGDIKIVIILRNPVDRAYSHYSFFARDTRDSRTFEEAIEQELSNRDSLVRPLHYVEMGYYADQVLAYLNNFSSVKVVLFDDFVNDQAQTMSEIYEFLGVDPSKGASLGGAYNASGMPKCKWLQQLFFKPTPFKMKIREFLVQRIIQEEVFARFMEKARSKNLKKVPLSDDMRERLYRLYRPDIERLQSILHRDLSAWLRE